jgi:hypothetical protein
MFTCLTGGSEILADPDALQWEEDWDVAGKIYSLLQFRTHEMFFFKGWDDEDGDDEFVTKLNEELQRYKNSLNQDNVTSNATTTEPEKN